MNGYGKTTILESLFLCLYGSLAFESIIKRYKYTNLLHSNYKAYLEQEALHRFSSNLSKKDSSEIKMKISIEISEDINNEWKIERQWLFKSGKFDDEKLFIWHNEYPLSFGQDAKQADELQKILINRLIQFEHSTLHIFDGEQIRLLTERSSSQYIKDGIEEMLGVSILEKLTVSLKNYQNSYLNGLNLKKEYQELLKNKEATEKEIENLQFQISKEIPQKIDETQAKLDEINTELSELNPEYQQLTGYANSTEDNNDVIKELTLKREEAKQIRHLLNEQLSSNIPFALISKTLLKDFNNQLHQEILKISYDAEEENLKPRRKDILNVINNSEVSPPLQDIQKKVLIENIEKIWNTHFVKPKNYSNLVIHTYLEDSIPKRQELIEQLKLKINKMQEPSSLYLKLEQLNIKINDLEQKSSEYNSKINSNQHRILELTEILKKYHRQHGELSQYIKSLENQKVGISSKIKSLQGSLGKIEDELIKSLPQRERYEAYSKVIELNNKIRQNIYPLKMDVLSKAVTKIYKQFAHKNQIDRIEIKSENNNIRIIFWSEDNTQIDFGKSAGENQLIALALTLGLAEISGSKLPLIIDTPLGRLDDEHGYNLVDFWTTLDRQVILLCTNREMPLEDYLSIKDSVTKTYLLQQVSVGQGVNRTFALENQYFSKKTGLETL